MKFNLTLCFLLVASLAFAQKREIRDVEKALESRKYDEAVTLFQAIDKNAVEDKYKADYAYLKGATIIGSPENSKATLPQIKEAKVSLRESVKLDADKKEDVDALIASVNNRLFKMAQDFVKANDAKQAAIIIDDLYLEDTSNLEMLNNSAKLFYGAGEFSKAKERYEELFNKNFTGVYTTYYAINKANGEKISFPNAKARDYAILSKEFNTPTMEDSSSAVGDIVLNLAWLYKQEGDLEKAKALFKTAQQKYPDDVSLKFKQADIYLLLEMMDEYKKASEDLSKGVSDPKIFDNLAEAAQKNSEWDQVIKYYTSSLALQPKNFAASVNISNAYIQKGNMDVTTAKEQLELYQLAVGHLEQANILKPDDKNVTGTLLQLYEVLEMTNKLNALKAKQ